MQVLLLVLFVAYLYVPYLLFKFFVEESVDLVRRKDRTRVEEFFGAALPSFILNGFAYLVLRLLSFGWEVAGFGTGFPRLDWSVASALLDPQLITFRAHVASGLASEILYIGLLYGSSCVAGRVYGSIELRLFERGAAPVYFLRSGRAHNRYRWFFALLFRRIWLPFFAESFHPLTSLMVQGKWLFVRTKDDRLYYGRFFEYINSGEGNVDSITLTHVQRFARTPVPTCLEAGRCPLTRLSGSFVMKWSEIVDINVASPDLMAAIRRKYAVKIRAWRSAQRTLLAQRAVGDVANGDTGDGVAEDMDDRDPSQPPPEQTTA